MNVYTCNTFHGHWPVGASAIVTAGSPERAAELLMQSLKEVNLAQEIDPKYLILVETELETVRILNDGEY